MQIVAMTGKPVVLPVVVHLIRTSVIKKERFISFRADDLGGGGGRFRNVYFFNYCQKSKYENVYNYIFVVFFFFALSFSHLKI